MVLNVLVCMIPVPCGEFTGFFLTKPIAVTMCIYTHWFQLSEYTQLWTCRWKQNSVYTLLMTCMHAFHMVFISLSKIRLSVKLKIMFMSYNSFRARGLNKYDISVHNIPPPQDKYHAKMSPLFFLSWIRTVGRTTPEWTFFRSCAHLSD